MRFFMIGVLLALCMTVNAQVGRAGNLFFHKYNVQNGGTYWGAPFIQYAKRKGRIVRSGLTTFYAPSVQGDGPGGGFTTAWGINLNDSYFYHHIVAADRKYWGAGSIVYIKAIKDSKGNVIWPQDDSPGRLMVVCDTGSAIKGPYRFDISVINQWPRYREYDGHWKIEVIPIYRTPVQRRGWGQGYPKSHIEKLTKLVAKEMDD